MLTNPFPYPPPHQTMKSHPLKSDQRYTIAREFCGHSKPRFVLRWCDEWIGSFATRGAAVVRAVGHKSTRNESLTLRPIAP